MSASATETLRNSLSAYVSYARDCVVTAAVQAIPFMPIVNNMTHIISSIRPSFLHDDPIDEPDAEDFLLKQGADIDKIVDIYIDRQLKFHEGVSEQNQASAKSILHASMVSRLQAVQTKIYKLAQKQGLGEVDVSLHIPSRPLHEKSWSPYSAVGGKLSSSFGGKPLIQITIAPIQVTADNIATVAAPSSDPSTILPKTEFLIAHELSHIANNDSWKLVAATLGATALGLFPWVMSYHTATSLGSYVVSSFAKSFGIQLVGMVALTAFRRHQEINADLNAMKALDTNAGAVDFFSTLQDNPLDFIHPSVKLRLQQARNFSSDPSKKQ